MKWAPIKKQVTLLILLVLNGSKIIRNISYMKTLRITRVKIRLSKRLMLTRILKRLILDRLTMIKTCVNQIKNAKMYMEQERKKGLKVTTLTHMLSITNNNLKTFTSWIRRSGNSLLTGLEANQFWEDTRDPRTLEAGCKSTWNYFKFLSSS